MSNKSNETNRPSHGIFQIKGDGDNARWIRVGAAWLHKDQKGANLIFDSIPLSGRVVLRELTEKEQSGEEGRAGEGGAE